MPASLPGVNEAANKANPAGAATTPFVIFSLLSGPKGSPLDVRKIASWGATKTGTPDYANDAANQYCSTGALSTGIGYGASSPIFGLTAPASIKAAGFNDNYTPGSTKVDPAVATVDSTYMNIGGGRSAITAGTGASGNGFPASWNVSVPSPYTAGYGIGGAGAAGSRDAGAGPAFTGFQIKTVTAAAGVAVGAVVETGFVNRSPRALVTGESVFGSSNTASAAVA